MLANCYNAVRLLACLLHRGYLTPRRSRQTQLIYLSRIRGSCQEQANRRFSPCNSAAAAVAAAANCSLCGISQCWSYTTSYTLMELDYAPADSSLIVRINKIVIVRLWYISSPMHDSLMPSASLFKMVLCTYSDVMLLGAIICGNSISPPPHGPDLWFKSPSITFYRISNLPIKM